MRNTVGVALLFLSAMAPAGEPPRRRPLNFSDIGVYGTLFDFCDFSVHKLGYFGKSAKPERLGHFRKIIRETAAKGKRNLVGLYTFDRIKHSRPIAEYLANTDAVLDAIDLKDVHAVFLSEENVTWNNGLKVLNALYDHIKKRHPDLPVYQWLTAPDVPHPKLKADGWLYDLYGAGRERSRRTFAKYIVTGKPFVMCINASPSVSLLDGAKGFAVSQAQVDLCREFNLPMFFFCVDSKWGSPYIWLRSEDKAIVPWRRWLLGVVNKAHRIDLSAARLRKAGTARLPLPSAQYSAGRPIEAAGDEANRYTFRDAFATAQFLDDANIMGLLNLRWDGLQERLILEPQAGKMDLVELQYHFVSEFEMSEITAKLTGRVMTSLEAPLRLALSVTGHSWPREATPPSGGKTGALTLTASGAGDAAFKGKEFWVRIVGRVDPKKRRVAAAFLDALEVTCRVAPPARREVVLTPDKQGRAAWRDDFASTKYLHLAHITNKKELEWRRGMLGTHGVTGRANAVALRWKFVSGKPLRNIRIRLDCMAHERALGASSALAASLDGKNKLAEVLTRKQPKDKHGRFRGTLELDLAKDERFQSIREFWVHAEMRNGSGVRTGTSNTLDAIEVEASAAPAH